MCVSKVLLFKVLKKNKNIMPEISFVKLDKFSMSWRHTCKAE